MTFLQLPSEEEAERWALDMQSTRVELEQKLRIEREAAAAAAQKEAALLAEAARIEFSIAASVAQEEAALSSEISLNRDRERRALEEADSAAAQMCDAIARAQVLQTQLRHMENTERECVAQEERLELELEQLQHKVRAAHGQEQKASAPSEPSSFAAVAASAAAVMSLPHDLVARVSVVLDTVSARLWCGGCDAVWHVSLLLLSVAAIVRGFRCSGAQ